MNERFVLFSCEITLITNHISARIIKNKQGVVMHVNRKKVTLNLWSGLCIYGDNQTVNRWLTFAVCGLRANPQS